MFVTLQTRLCLEWGGYNNHILRQGASAGMTRHWQLPAALWKFTRAGQTDRQTVRRRRAGARFSVGVSGQRSASPTHHSSQKRKQAQNVASGGSRSSLSQSHTRRASHFGHTPGEPVISVTRPARQSLQSYARAYQSDWPVRPSGLLTAQTVRSSDCVHLTPRLTPRRVTDDTFGPFHQLHGVPGSGRSAVFCLGLLR